MLLRSYYKIAASKLTFKKIKMFTTLYKTISEPYFLEKVVPFLTYYICAKGLTSFYV